MSMKEFNNKKIIFNGSFIFNLEKKSLKKFMRTLFRSKNIIKKLFFSAVFLEMFCILFILSKQQKRCAGKQILEKLCR